MLRDAFRPPWKRGQKDELEQARREVARSTNRMAFSTVLALQATDLAVRLSDHRAENHFAQRLEELFKESRA